MALSDESTNMVMPVAPAMFGGSYGSNGGFGGMNGDWAWLLLLLLAFGGGWGMGGFGGMGAGMFPMMMGMDGGFGLYPWMNNSQNINSGFRDQMLQTTVSSIGDKVTSGFGDVQNSLCSGFAGVNATVNGAANSIAQRMSANEIASLNRSFAEQTANMQGFTGLQAQLASAGSQNQLATADLKYTIATENCADRSALAEGIRDIMENCNRNNQAVLDKLCALELDGVKSQLAQAQRENVGLQNQLNMANLAASQADQTAQLRASQTTTANQLVSELRSCPIPSQPVYGNQPIFTCGGGNNVGCGCNGNGFIG